MGHYLVTGAAGFIASAVSKLLLDSDHEVTGVDNLNDAYDRRLKLWRLERLNQHRNFKFIEADICHARLYEALLEGGRSFDCVINLAARAGVRQSVLDPFVYIDTNTNGTLKLLDFCRDRGIPKFVLASTSSVYGNCAATPFSEDQASSEPVSPYAASKKAAEVLAFSYHHLYGIDVSILRYFTVYGPAGRPDMSVFRFVRWVSEGDAVQVSGTGEQSRDFTFVDDIAAGTVAATRLHGYNIVNLGSDRPLRLLTLLNIVESELGRKAKIQFSPMHDADVLTTWANIDRARKMMDWFPTTRAESGIQQSVRWYQDNRTLASRLTL